MSAACAAKPGVDRKALADAIESARMQLEALEAVRDLLPTVGDEYAARSLGELSKAARAHADEMGRHWL